MKATLKKPTKVFTKFYPLIFSRHPSHEVLRNELPLLPFRSVVRMGSTTPHLRERIECNTIQAVRNSASKLLMKQCFTRAEVKTADWWTYNNHTFRPNNTDGGTDISVLPYPIIAKTHNGSRGEGNTLLESQQELESWMRGKTLSNYIFEKFYNYSREYRLHVTTEGCFYTCRKMLKRDAPEDNRWQRHDDNCVWVVEENTSFDKPINWNVIVTDCVKALRAVGLDIGAFDVKVQSATKSNGRVRTTPEYIIIESCSAPSFGTITAQKYLVEIPKVLKRKYENSRV